ncbi:MAG: hypothetical protein R3F19_05120 [Verrucomicrobiales bacterium]
MSVEILQIELLALPGKVCSRQKFEKNFTPVDERPAFPGFLKSKKSPFPRIVKVGLAGRLAGTFIQNVRLSERPRSGAVEGSPLLQCWLSMPAHSIALTFSFY